MQNVKTGHLHIHFLPCIRMAGTGLEILFSVGCSAIIPEHYGASVLRCDCHHVEPILSTYCCCLWIGRKAF